ncbi:MAG: bifunctional hydroxymethylpyrimidine kinase/phosphomethylpyrimidine kinase [Desulfoplanes sp.]
MTLEKYIPPCVLTIAGSDSGGGAGIQADLKTMTVLGTYGLSVITALTAQNTTGVYGIEPASPEFVAKQLQVVLDDFPLKAAKTGMLFSAEIMEAIVPLLRKVSIPLVVDPVCVSQSGHRLLQEDAIGVMRTLVLPLATLVTPNRPEAETLTGMRIDSPDDVREAITRILDMGSKAVLLKGGHFEGDVMVDWLGMPGQEPVPLKHARVCTKNVHGTGCTLSAAIAAYLARGTALENAVVLGKEYLLNALTQSFDLGHGDGPTNHLAPFMSHFGY